MRKEMKKTSKKEASLVLQDKIKSLIIKQNLKSGDLMQEFIDNNLADMTILNERLSLASAMHDDKAVELEHLADALVESINNTDVK